MRRQAKSEKPKKINLPHLPELEQLFTPPAGMALLEETRHIQLSLHSREWSDQRISRLQFIQCRLNGLRACRADFSQLELTDCLLQDCDLANAIWRGANSHRVKIQGCRLLGLNTNESHWKDTLFSECNAALSQFRLAEFSSVRFEDCNLRGADFQEADLRGVVFANCDLREAQFSFAKLKGTDFRSSNIDGIRVGADHVKGAIVEPFQAANLARLLGLDVRWTNDE